MARVFRKADAELVASAPDLLAERDAARAEVERLRDELDRMRPHAEGCNWQRRGDAYPCSCMTEVERLTRSRDTWKARTDAALNHVRERDADNERLREALRRMLAPTPSEPSAHGEKLCGVVPCHECFARAALAGAPSEHSSLCEGSIGLPCDLPDICSPDTRARDRALAERVREACVQAALTDMARARGVANHLRALNIHELLGER